MTTSSGGEGEGRKPLPGLVRLYQDVSYLASVIRSVNQATATMPAEHAYVLLSDAAREVAQSLDAWARDAELTVTLAISANPDAPDMEVT